MAHGCSVKAPLAILWTKLDKGSWKGDCSILCYAAQNRNNEK